ncbi:MAG: IS5 family transposase [Thermomicrobiales bacterium]
MKTQRSKRQQVSDALWEAIAPLIPPDPPKPKGGRPPVPARKALGGILFILRTGIGWQELTAAMGFGSGSTCWRRWRDWQQAGIWASVPRTMLDRLGDAGTIDWSRARGDGGSVAAKKGGDQTGPNPVDRGKPGTKRPLMVDRQGIPLVALLTGANRQDSPLLLPLGDAVPAIKTPRGGRRKRPAKLHADKGYDFGVNRRVVRARGIVPRIARRGIEAKERLGRDRWVGERDFAWLNQFKRLAVRYERRADIDEGLVHLGCSLICLNALHWE